ncbi:MAG: T9SS type A sorting domain-containing protein, partial [Chitinophagales bacterium]|nr:T9SS type A sorting domain-containing protein [Chitinophagales bacterium]
DITFSDDGITTMDFDGAYDFGFACAQQSDGKILVGGFNVLNITDPYPDADFILTRFNVDGTPDLSFGTDAKVKNDFGSLNDYITAIQIQADGKIIATGCSGIYAEQGFAVARYISGLNVGVLDFVTQDNMLYLYPNPIESNAMLSYTLQNDTHLSIYIIDQQGKKIINVLNNILINKGLQTQQIILPSYLSKGIYHIVLESNEGAISVQFVH